MRDMTHRAIPLFVRIATLTLPIQVYVNDEPRDVLSLESARIANLESLSLEYKRGDDGGRHGPSMYATDRDYIAGAYHLHATGYGSTQPGLYRVRGVEIHYTNGATAVAPVADDIVVKVLAVEPPTEPVPVFSAR